MLLKQLFGMDGQTVFNVIFFGSFILITLIILYFVLRKSSVFYHSKWHILVEGTSCEPKVIYESVINQLKERGVTKISTAYISKKERTFLPGSRTYLSITYKGYKYELCVAPFGKDNFFVSWWLFKTYGAFLQFLEKIPVLARWARKLKEPTIYEHDTITAFMTLTQSIIKEQIEALVNNPEYLPGEEWHTPPTIYNPFDRK